MAGSAWSPAGKQRPGDEVGRNFFLEILSSGTAGTAEHQQRWLFKNWPRKSRGNAYTRIKRLGKTARVTSADPVTKETISLVVGPDGVKEIRPATTVVSFLTPDRPFDQDVIMSFCHFVHFFAPLEPAEKWTTEHPGTLLLSVDDAFALGQLTNQWNAGDTLRS